MQLVRQSHEILHITHDALGLIERAGRTCYQSFNAVREGSAERFVASLILRRHESVIEHGTMTVRFVTNRGVTHELVRHRLASYSQESTRYVNYAKQGLTFIEPVWLETASPEARDRFLAALADAERHYLDLVGQGMPNDQAREVLPNAVKTEIVVTANFREWRHIFMLRTSTRAHPQIRSLMQGLLDEARKRIPVVFEDICEQTRWMVAPR